MEAITQKLVHSSHYAAVAALSSFSRSSTTIAGPALGGFLIARYGAATGYLVDFFSYLFAFASIGFMNRSLPPERSAHRSTWQEMRESLSYAGARPVLIGTYLVDIVAMIFAFPTALFPAMAETWGGSRAAGFLYAGMSVGSLIVSLFSGWSGRIQRHGLMVVLAAAAWGLSIVGLGLSHSLAQALFFLAWAGATDSVSAIYRMVIWNETIPNDRRGKLAGLEMISYLIGPLLGNLRAGWMAGVAGISISIWMGGLICTFGVGICGLLLPEFWRYRARPS